MTTWTEAEPDTTTHPPAPAFELASGSVVGREHAAAGRNNQDACCSWQGQQATVAVVADGCGSGRFSEVGARAGARLLVEALRQRVPRIDAGPVALVLEEVRLAVLAALRPLAEAFGGSLPDAVSEHFLFTLLGAVVTERTAVVFALGDGVIAVNGAVDVLVSPGNAPPYLGYALLDRAAQARRFEIRHLGSASSVDSLLIGTDGVADLLRQAERRLPGRDEAVGPLSRLWDDDRHFANPAALGRRLRLLNRETVRADWQTHELRREHGLLPDDTSLLVLRRRRSQ
jgi:hypothetical protein